MTAYDSIRLEGLRAFGHHGVLPAERHDGQEFVVDLDISIDARAAAVGDDLGQTVDYGALASQVVELVGGTPYDLIETLAEAIAGLVLQAPAASAVTVTVNKPSAPILVPFGNVAVVVRRTRQWPPVAVPDVARNAGFAGELDEPPVEDTQDAPAVPLPVAPPVPAPAEDIPPVPLPDEVPDFFPDMSVENEQKIADRLDEAPLEPVRVVLALGSNMGDATATLKEAVADLDSAPQTRVIEVGPLARTVAVGGPDQPDFLNTVLVVETRLAPRALLAEIHRIEAGHGRERAVRWGPRTLDIDIIVYGSVIAVSDDLELPHPRAHERAFVLLPWAQLDGDAVLGGLGGGPVVALAETAPDRGGVRSMALDWLAVDGAFGAGHSAGSSQIAPNLTS